MVSLGTRLGAFFAITWVRHARGDILHACGCLQWVLLVIRAYIYIVSNQFEFVVIVARISYACSSAKRGHLGEAPLRPSRQLILLRHLSICDRELISHVVPRPLLRLGSTRAICLCS